jgi:hypothetical protein
MRPRVRREHILAFRRRRNGLVERVGWSADALRSAAAVGLTDSMPRAAVLSLHARLDGVRGDVLDDSALTQVWGPRFSTYVAASDDVAPFTLGRLPTDARGLQRATDMAARIGEVLDEDSAPMAMSDIGRALGINPNALRYASPTGTIRIRWDGARQPTVTVVPPPEVDPHDARLELARRYLRTMGPTTAEAFGQWAGVKPKQAAATFDELADELVAVTTPTGEASILAADDDELCRDPEPVEGVRLLPSGDAFWMLWGVDRQLLVAHANRRDELWTPRVWPGAVLVDGEIVGVWRRAKRTATVTPWQRLSAATRQAIEAEAATMPLPDPDTPVEVAWDT